MLVFQQASYKSLRIPPRHNQVDNALVVINAICIFVVSVVTIVSVHYSVPDEATRSVLSFQPTVMCMVCVQTTHLVCFSVCLSALHLHVLVFINAILSAMLRLTNLHYIVRRTSYIV
jgi:hypothetical protein